MQKEIDEWQREVFPESDSVSKISHLREEVNELMDEFNTLDIDKEKIAMELADCALLLFGIAGLNDIDLLESVETKFEINKKRKWKDPVDGVYFHKE